MGNRAVITASELATDPAIYLHWNGGPESVLAFLHAAKELGFRDPTVDSYGMAYLQAVIALYFGDGLSTGIDRLEISDTKGDNGTYCLGRDFTIARRRNVSKAEIKVKTVEDLDEKDKVKYASIKSHVIRKWNAAQAVAETGADE